jgi:tetratricopeptide (TPR) repeat protein
LQKSIQQLITILQGNFHKLFYTGFQVDISKEHGNWLTVGELIRSIQKPISTYVDEIVKAFHEKLCKDLLRVGKCRSTDDCKKKTKPNDLCYSCESWFKELEASHKKGNNPSWRKNCKSAEWSEDYWEVAKFFMPALGSNLSSTKDAESTDLPSLLNVLEWMKDGAFLGKTRVSVDLVRKLRSQTHPWVHAPQQTYTDDEKDESFSIATDFLENQEKVFSHAENAQCLKHLKHLKINGVTNVAESERRSLRLLRDLIQESRLPNKSPKFTARETEIQQVITFLGDEREDIVSLHGGPGFGKTEIAIEVSHKLGEDDNILVVFSELAKETTVDEMIRRLCLDVGVNYDEDDPKKSLILGLKMIEKKVVLVMDDIDNLLEENTRSCLDDFIRLLRKESKCQIVTTSRSSYKIPRLSIGNVDVGEMEDKACMELLKKQCPKQEDEFLERLAELCGKIPLAMCIAGSQVDDFENSDELLQHLQNQPMKILECPESDQYVYRAFNMSYEKCSGEEKETLLRLAVFEGNFSEHAARVVIEKENLDTKRVLKKLVRRSLIKQPTMQRYSIHLLIKHFLKDQKESKNETAKRARTEASRAEVLMVKYYLQLGHDLTMKSYSKDGYKANREALKQEVHNIQNVLKISCQQDDPKTSDISDCLKHSKVYTTSARHFSLLVGTIIHGSIVDEFLQRCANLAKERMQHDIKLNFDCLLAEQKRRKAVATGKHDEYLMKMEAIEKEFQMHYKDLNFEENKSLGAHYHYLYGRYRTFKSLKLSRAGEYEKSLDLQIKAREHLEKSLELRKMLLDASAPVGITQADKVWALLQLGNIWKVISKTEHCLHKTNESNESSGQAEEYYRQAEILSKKHLDEHELTSTCYNFLGDLFLANKKYELAVECYIAEKEMRKRLGLELGTQLLNNLTICLMKSNRANEAIEVLESARDMLEKMFESEKEKRSKAKVYASLAIAYDSVQNNSEAVKYARKALELEKDVNINRMDLNKLHKIVSNNVGNN